MPAGYIRRYPTRHLLHEEERRPEDSGVRLVEEDAWHRYAGVPGQALHDSGLQQGIWLEEHLVIRRLDPQNEALVVPAPTNLGPGHPTEDGLIGESGLW